MTITTELVTEALYRALDHSWPAAAVTEVSGWIVREGKGGGNRVSAASLADPGLPGGEVPDIALAEDRMSGLGQSPLFMIRTGEDPLDEALDRRGYRIVDPVVILTAPASRVAVGEPPGPDVSFCDAPMPIQARIWAEGGIGAARLAVMRRTTGPRVWILGRTAGRPAGAVFAAIHDGIVMAHALEVREGVRRRGLGASLMAAAAGWAVRNGARSLAVAVTRENTGARELYRTLGLVPGARYHYRRKAGERGERR